MVKTHAAGKAIIRTPDQRLRVFVSSTLLELADERNAAKRAIDRIRLHPVMFEMGARPHPPRELYQAYIEQSHIFIGIYWEKYGWVAPGMDISGLEDEFIMSEGKPRLLYIKKPTSHREEQLQNLILKLQNSALSYKVFSDPKELGSMIENDLVQLLSERFEMTDDESVIPRGISRERIELPAPHSRLIGRKKEVSELIELFSDKNTRLITLSGTGGIGKSRLALEVAWQMQEYFPDGIYFIPLAHISDPALVPSAIVQSIFPAEISMRPPDEIIKEGLMNKSSLLLIDNFEQVIGSADFISRILTYCPDIKVMVTSRELLRVSGEKEYIVVPLSIPQLNKDLSVDDQLRSKISQSSAVQLFVERAQAIKPGFSLTNENAAAIAGICIQLDGIPLAIELAAARSKILSPREMLPHLNRSLSLLTDGARDMPERHRRLYATIDWSFNLLEEEEKQTLRRLSVFAGGCTMASAWLITSNLSEPDVIQWSRLAIFMRDPNVGLPPPYIPPDYGFARCMESLVNKNLIYTQEGESGETRFYLYKMISEYAGEKLEEADESFAIKKNHLAYFLRMAEETSDILRTTEAPYYYRDLDREMENMRAALNFGIDHCPALALRMAVGLGEFWDISNMPAEANWWIVKLLEAVERSDESYPDILPAIAKAELGRVAFRLGNYEQARRYSEELMDTGRRSGNKYTLLDGISLRCMIAAYLFEQDASLSALAKEGLTLARELNYKIKEIDMLQNATAAASAAGDNERAVKLGEKSLVLSRQIGASRWEAISLIVTSFALYNLNRIEEGEKLCTDSLDLCIILNDNILITYALLGISQAALMKGNMEKGVRLIGALEKHTERSGTPLVPMIKFMFSQIENSVRAHMGEEIFNNLKSEGRRLSLEEACDLAKRTSEIV